MKTQNMLFIYFIILILQVSCNINDQPNIKKGLEYPDLISPIYYIDTFQIISPRVAIVDSVPYIFSLERMIPFEDKKDFLNQKGTMRFLTPDLNSIRSIEYLKIHEYQNWKKSLRYLSYQNEFYFDEIFIKDDSIQNIPIYTFLFEPECFILTFFATIDSVVTPIGHDDSLLEIMYSKDYLLALIPIYNKGDLKKINKLEYQRMHSRE